jgi:hypothetical protein
MSTKTVGIILVVVGIVIALVSVLADSLGIGIQPGTFGMRQWIGIIAGIVAIVVGVVLYMRAGRSTAA